MQVGACGFNLNHTVNLATSKDLVTWTLVGSVLDSTTRPTGIIFSPWVARSTSTGDYVLWYNVLPVVGGQGDFDAAYYAIATSRNPAGPFTTVRLNVTGLAYTRLPDAASIFVDDDGAGYIAFTHEDTHINHVQQLTADLLGPLKGGNVSAQIGAQNNEGVTMFKRHGLYYVAFGQCCCFCGEGTNVEAWVAPSPLGPYTLAGTITTNTWQAQTGAIWSTGQDFVLYGDRWQSAPDHIKAHDFSYMSPVAFSANGSVIEQPKFQDFVVVTY